MDTDNRVIKAWEGQVLGGESMGEKNKQTKGNICNMFNNTDKYFNKNIKYYLY